MADSLTAANDLTRKRSRSSSPTADSAAKKANQAAAGPANLEVDDEDDGSAAAAAAAGPPTNGGGNDADAKPESTTAAAPMNVDSSGIPAKPVGAEVSSEDAQAQSHASQNITMRTLIVTQDASVIIGKQGKNINEIRDRSGSKLNITESVAGNPERIMSVSGPLDAVSKAFGLIVRRINDEPFDVPSVPGSRAVTIRFIVPNSRMGSVIGKAGAKIKEIQEASGARLQASEAMLPGSTERVLSVSGVADAIHIAVYYIGTVLLEHPTNTANTSYRPGAPEYGSRPPADRSGPPRSGGGMGPAVGPGAQSQAIFIPNELVGSIIGKGGAKINEVRQVSACQIKINEPGEPAPGGGPNERLVTITGQPTGIQTAIQMLYKRLEEEKNKHS
ncbi:PAB1 binding protein [Rhodotorula sphaerocarpa]